MATPISLSKVFPLYKVEHDCILSKQGDITLVYEATLPEIFTLSDQEYETFHQILIKAIKVLPTHSIFHKQDWFISKKYQANYEVPSDLISKKESSFFAHSSERFFHERPYLDHQCYIMLSKKTAHRKPSSSIFSNLIRRTIVPEETLNPQYLQEFLDSAGQFDRILSDSGYIKLKRIKEDELVGTKSKAGLLERYCFLLSTSDKPVIKDIHLKDELRIGDQSCQLYLSAPLKLGH